MQSVSPGHAGWLMVHNILQEIAEIKLPDLNCVKIEAAMNIVEGTARNMGVKIAA